MLLRSMSESVNELSPLVNFFQLTTDEFFGIEAMEDKRFLREFTDSFEVHIHSLDLSFCSADGPNRKSLLNLKMITENYRIKSISDHVGFNKINGINIGLPILPPILSEESLDITQQNITEIISTLNLPFYIENNSICTKWITNEMSDVDFLHRLTSNTNCELLLDLANLMADAKNFNFNAKDYIKSLPLNKIAMLHIAGGDWLDGYNEKQITGGHNKPVQSQVWELLDYTLAISDPKYIVLERSRNIVFSEVINDLKSIHQHVRDIR